MSILNINPAGLLVILIITIIFSFLGGGLVRYFAKAITYRNCCILFFWAMFRAELVWLFLKFLGGIMRSYPNYSPSGHENSTNFDTLYAIAFMISLAYFINRDVKKHGVLIAGWLGIGGKVVAAIFGLLWIVTLAIFGAQYFMQLSS